MNTYRVTTTDHPHYLLICADSEHDAMWEYCRVRRIGRAVSELKVEFVICGENGCTELAHVRPASRWKPVGGCYGKIHLVVDGISLCGLKGEWFQSWTFPPSPTCKKCQKPRNLSRMHIASIIRLANLTDTANIRPM